MGKRLMMENILLQSRYNVFSQNGEDGVLQALISGFDISHGTFCEFGAWDGKHLSNTYNLLLNHGWRGVYIEGDENKFKDLQVTQSMFSERVSIIKSYVSPSGDNCLDEILSKDGNLPYDFDVLSIDVDGMDYHIWDGFVNYRPKIVIIEIASHLGKSSTHIPPNDVLLAQDNGAGYIAMCELGCSKGYVPIIHFGNIFLGDRDFLLENGYPINPDIDSLFHWGV